MQIFINKQVPYSNYELKSLIILNTAKKSTLRGAFLIVTAVCISWFVLLNCCSILDTLVSGSPILQNGKLIGAVTHVLIDDPTTGYAIFAENMLKEAESTASDSKPKKAS